MGKDEVLETLCRDIVYSQGLETLVSGVFLICNGGEIRTQARDSPCRGQEREVDNLASEWGI